MLDGLRRDSPNQGVRLKVFVPDDNRAGSDDAPVWDFRPMGEQDSLANPASIADFDVLDETIPGSSFMGANFMPAGCQRHLGSDVAAIADFDDAVPRGFEMRPDPAILAGLEGRGQKDGSHDFRTLADVVADGIQKLAFLLKAIGPGEFAVDEAIAPFPPEMEGDAMAEGDEVWHKWMVKGIMHRQSPFFKRA